MNNKILLGVGAVVVVAVAVFAFKGSGGDEQAMDGKTSLGTLYNSKKAQECSYSVEMSGTTSSATIYIGDGKVRTDSVVVTGGETTKGSMIIDGQTSYIWSDATNQGLKMSLEKFKEQEGESNTQVQAMDFDQEYDYSCKGWSVDNSKFSPPGNVTFVDFSAMMPSATPKASGSGNSSQCATCDQVPAGSARDACKQSLGCK